MNTMMPGNPRYQPKELVPYFGYDYLCRWQVEVEIALLHTLGEIGVIPTEVIAELTPEVEEQLRALLTTQQDEIERTVTKHDIRALIQLIQPVVGERLAPWVHLMLTSYDIIETARALQYKRAYGDVIRPSIAAVVRLLSNQAKSYADTLQIGRTHGQHALPITVGFWLATILYRLVRTWQQLDDASRGLVGKISGAVGAYNAQILLLPAGAELESKLLARLGLHPSAISTQILPPEPLAEFLFETCLMSAVLGQFGRDCRHLMRSEIGEIKEEFGAKQVGSSTMAHKRNPINFENLEGTWLKTKSEFGKVFDTLISDHQRDLVGSSIARDFPVILINLQHQLNTLLRRDKERNLTFLERIVVDEAVCQRNFDQAANTLMAEPLYIALQMFGGYKGDAHDLLNHQLVPLAQRKGCDVAHALQGLTYTNPDLKQAWDKIPLEIRRALASPKDYIGHARHKTMNIIIYAEATLRTFSVKT
jgi:adenylosuccinate lyase